MGKRINEIERGINSALFDLYNECFFDQSGGPASEELTNTRNMFKLHNILKDISNFATNLTSFAGVVGYRQGYIGEFFYHATIGSAIASCLVKEDHSEVGDDIYSDIYDSYRKKSCIRLPRGKISDNTFNKYDLEVGFWVSFYNTNRNLGLSFFESDTNIGLVGLGNLIKTMIKQESSFNPYDKNGNVKRHQINESGPNDEIDGWGLMAVGKDKVNELNNLFSLNFDANSFGPSSTNNFTNIGVGIGHLCVQRYYNENGGYKDIEGDPSFINKGDNSLEAWLIAVKCYNGFFIEAHCYRDIVRERYRRYRSQ